MMPERSIELENADYELSDFIYGTFDTAAGVFQLLAYLDMLGAVLLAFAAADAV